MLSIESSSPAWRPYLDPFSSVKSHMEEGEKGEKDRRNERRNERKK